MQPKRNHILPDLEELLSSGGDARIVRNLRGMNKYGCFSVPQPDILSYGSSTASTISSAGFAAAGQLYERLEYASRMESSQPIYARELFRIRNEIIGLYGLDSLDIIFGASGTDLHLFAAQLLYKENGSLLVVMPEAAETGSGVPAALSGHHFSDCAALGSVTQGEAIDSGDAIEIAMVKNRMADGHLRDAAIVDSEIEALAARAATEGKHVLISLTDVSKTGLIIPSLTCVLNLKHRFPKMVDILVDACQFRLSNETIRAYLKQDFLLVMTGSKFVSGPAFCGALLVPAAMAKRLRSCTLPPSLSLYSAKADWSDGWAAQSILPDTANYGLLLRFEAALAELRAFRSLSETDILAFVKSFAIAVKTRLSDDPVFQPLATRDINRQPLVSEETWDQIPTIFPFLMHHPKSGTLLNREEITKLYEHMKMAGCYVGQPVVSDALRLCLDMRLIVDALSPAGRGAGAIIAGATRVLDKAAMLAEQIL